MKLSYYVGGNSKVKEVVDLITLENGNISIESRVGGFELTHPKIIIKEDRFLVSGFVVNDINTFNFDEYEFFI